MIHVSVRGIVALRQALLIIGATTLLPHLIKSSKPLAEKMGKKLVDWGQWLQEEQPVAQKPDSDNGQTAKDDKADPVKNTRKRRVSPKAATAAGKKATPNDNPESDAN